MRIQEDLVDQLFNPIEKRLARALLLLAHLENEARTEATIPRISQETLAAMIGATRSRVSFFLNRFRTLGLIDYNGKQYANGELHVHRSLRTVVLDDWHPS